MNTDRLKVKALTVGDNPEWVEGSYVSPEAVYNKSLLLPLGAVLNKCGHYLLMSDRVRVSDVCAVGAGTICQCTGLKDSNGNLIYEGDEVVVKDFRPHDEAEYDPLAGVFDEYEDLQGFVEYQNGRHYICSPGYMLGLFGFESTQMTLTGKNIHDPK